MGVSLLIYRPNKDIPLDGDMYKQSEVTESVFQQ